MSIRIPYRLLGGGGRLRKGFLREIFFPILVGVGIGLLLGRLYTETGDREETHTHAFVRRVNLNEYEYPDGSVYFLRCIVLLHPDAHKPLSFIMAIRDTYGQQCNQTYFYTTNPEIQKRVGDQQVFLIQSKSNGFYWNYFQMALNHSLTIPAMWTIVIDEQAFLKVSNIRRLLMNFDFKEKLILGRVIESKISRIFPWLSNTRLSLQAGILLSQSAIRSLLSCTNLLLPRPTEKAIIDCSQKLQIPVVDPVDEGNMHLFHYNGILSLVPQAKDGDHACCSDHAVSFGQQSFKEIRMAYYASENWGVFGVNGIEEVNATYAIERHKMIRTTPIPTTTTKKPTTKKAKSGLL